MSNYKKVDGYKIRDFQFYQYGDKAFAVSEMYDPVVRGRIKGIPVDNYVFVDTMTIECIHSLRWSKKIRIFLRNEAGVRFRMTKKGFNNLLSKGLIHNNQVKGHWTFNTLNGDLVVDFLDNKI